jgi:hypothetical protein
MHGREPVNKFDVSPSNHEGYEDDKGEDIAADKVLEAFTL